MQKIVSHLWYDGAAEEAMRLYASLIPGSRIGRVTRYPAAGQEVHGHPEDSVMTVEATLGDTSLVALNGGPHFRFTPAVSLFVTLEDEAAVDRLWAGLVEGGEVLMPLDRYDWSPRYGWLADRWGLNWQIALGRVPEVGRTVVPSLLFTGERAGEATAAIEHYAATFPGCTVDGILRYGPGEQDREGLVKHAQFRLPGGTDTIMVMDSTVAAPAPFTEALSLMVQCEDQAEIDRLWTALSAVPKAEQCGWLKDRFGVSWQITPRALGTMLAEGDAGQRERLFASFMPMKKLDLSALRRAFAGEDAVQAS